LKLHLTHLDYLKKEKIEKEGDYKPPSAAKKEAVQNKRQSGMFSRE